jgi:hypothetical protein
MVLGNEANSQAVLPAFVLGLDISRHYQKQKSNGGCGSSRSRSSLRSCSCAAA